MKAILPRVDRIVPAEIAGALKVVKMRAHAQVFREEMFAISFG